ncbi:unnamed protein product [Rotaria sp. Silwood1]|nr:unnamed protein product [Rotaria sp. Silwood1]CAF1075317.1 unnamed protein product [Rotaria sp. Silwood1]CAF3437663.1 unnamed protein product [Rotaria sp. Silwood1]CAF3438776.1 unnamed protein product [Rotaria sp. Silwood1]CAF4599590.1 unnamed protein product [Rotaria sp. Silwood1]
MYIGHHSHILYFVDFSLTKQYHDFVIYVHRNFVYGKSLTDTAQYASLHTYQGSLPWQGLKAKIKQQKYEKIVELEQTISIEELCSDLLLQIITINLYVKSLTFDEQSDYDHIKRQLRTIIVVNNGK